jgi:hypothetical protein
VPWFGDHQDFGCSVRRKVIWPISDDLATVEPGSEKMPVNEALREKPMIVFDLECSKGHRFEGWFNNTGSFEEQNEKHLVTCPVCGDGQIKRMISPVATCALRPGTEQCVESPSIDRQRVVHEMIVEYISKSFENVGTEFAKEALKMHYGVTKKKNIRGSATEEEEKVLRQEKIEFFKLPMPKEETNEEK